MSKDAKDGNGVHKKLEFLFEYGVDTDKRIIYFNDDVEQHSVDRIIKALSFFEDTPSQSLELKVCSYGGSMDQMFALYDAIVTTKNKVITVGTGCICSAAVILLACGDERYVTENSMLMSHNAESIGVGNPATLLSQAKAFQAMEDRAWDLLERHSNWTAKRWKESAQKKGEVWLTPAQMLKAGVIDGIRDKSKPSRPRKIARKKKNAVRP
jgi:ATP-dependent protease ClpP protease subunit